MPTNQPSDEAIEAILIRLKYPLQIPKQGESISAYDERQAYHEKVFIEAHQAITTLLVEARKQGERAGRSDELLKISEWGRTIDDQWNSHFEQRLEALLPHKGEDV